jgi:hypothetical protein
LGEVLEPIALRWHDLGLALGRLTATYRSLNVMRLNIPDSVDGEAVTSQLFRERDRLTAHSGDLDERIQSLVMQRVNLVLIDRLAFDELAELVSKAGEPGSELRLLCAAWRWCSKLFGSCSVGACSAHHTTINQAA